MTDSTFLTRAVLKNYKSIAACDVSLGPLTFLVGPNGSGKSNFLDALRFVADSLRRSLGHAIRDRGGIKDVRRRSSGHPNNFGLRLEFRLSSGRTGHYAFQIGALPNGAYRVQEEQCRVTGEGSTGTQAYFWATDDHVSASISPTPLRDPGSLYLVSLSGSADFREIFELVSRMGFYNLNPDRIRDLQSPDAGDLLARDGSNIASVIAQMEQHDPAAKGRIEEYLEAVVPGIRGVSSKSIEQWETLEFRQAVAGSMEPWRFKAANMSDGTLRALGVLVALLQSVNGSGRRVPLVGIEEPEVALHPAAAGILRDELREASDSRQIIVTSHSPDLLDDPDISTSSILAVAAAEGTTRIGPIDTASRSVLKDRLFTAGELLRLRQIEPKRDILTLPVVRLFDPHPNQLGQ